MAPVIQAKRLMLVIDEQVEMGEKILADDAANSTVCRVQPGEAVDYGEHVSDLVTADLYLGQLRVCPAAVSGCAGNARRSTDREPEL